MWDKLKWLALVPGVLFLTLAVLALLEQRWPGLVKGLLLALFFFTVPFWERAVDRVSDT
ncbi:hypothetical protein [Pseudonocardia parietis]|uniref:Uncharacterized protein n=1 Tax=Pseudonocardia parietis TaxID=570936 RepID=A0ABS4VX40_9PSEU|nr:hypothetical protein [Pseudonocardia parietis]MBP2368506.1 hypothetical protein [Pseudonocardia parietis]